MKRGEYLVHLPLVTLEPQGKAPVPHRCGRCNNGTGVTNPACPNNKDAHRAETEIVEAYR